MMFSTHPEKFFPYTQIDVVIFPEGKEDNPNRFTERTFKGSVPEIITKAMDYIQSVVIQEQVIKPKKDLHSYRFFNYPYQALEEAVVNAMYHRDYQESEPVEITIEPEGVSILSFSGPDRSISALAIKECRKLKSRRYRNRRLRDFLKELDMSEGRGTGIPTIQKELKNNGSPRASIETDDDRTYFLMDIPVHEGFGNEVILNVEKEGVLDSSNLTSNLTGNSTALDKIFNALKANPLLTYPELASLLGYSRSYVQKCIKMLKETKRIRRVGSKTYGGYWEIIENLKS